MNVPDQTHRHSVQRRALGGKVHHRSIVTDSKKNGSRCISQNYTVETFRGSGAEANGLRNWPTQTSQVGRRLDRYVSTDELLSHPYFFLVEIQSDRSPSESNGLIRPLQLSLVILRGFYPDQDLRIGSPLKDGCNRRSAARLWIA